MPFTPPHDNVATMIAESLKKYAAKPLFGLRAPGGGSWSWVTYGEVARMVDDLRGGLASIGVGPGDHVAVISNNRLEWAVACWAVQGLGAAYVPMYENQLDKEWKYILDDCGAKIVLAGTPAVEARVRKVAKECPAVTHVVGFEATDENSYKKLLEIGARSPAPAVKPKKDDVAFIVYTSGTTGNPKGVCLTQWNLVTNILGVAQVVPFTTDDRSVSFLPWAHVLGGSIEIGAIAHSGASTAICEEVSKLIEMLPEVKPTILVAVPRIWNRIYDNVNKNIATKPKPIQAIFRQGMAAVSAERRGEKLGLKAKIMKALASALVFGKIRDRFGGRLAFAVSGSAALSRDVAEFIDNLGITVYEGYGMTECSGVATANTPKERRIGSVGKAIPGVEIELDHTAVGADREQGEIIIKGMGVMACYYNKPDETAATVVDGALRSGDLGKMDGDGFLYITGRVKELYKLENGKYVAPAPLEEKITLSPYIAQALVHGADKPHNVALIVPDFAALKGWAQEQGIENGDMSALLRDQRVRDLITKEISRNSEEWKGYERVKSFDLLEEEFTTANDMLTPSLKLKRRNALKKYEGRIQALYGA